MDERLGIVGTGAIATGLARAAADHGDVVMWARSEGSAERAADAVHDSTDVVTELSSLSECTLVVEAVAEELEIKCDLHRRLDSTLPAETILATTTSSLSVQEIAEASGRPDRFGCLHVFNPVEKMKLVELAFPREASEDTRSRLHALCEHLEKEAVEVPDAAGFVVNRLLFPYLFDAVRLLDAGGLSPEDVDTCMKLGAGHPMGPLALLDFVGLDVAAAIGESIGVEVPGRVRELVAEGNLGKKSGAGFYEYGVGADQHAHLRHGRLRALEHVGPGVAPELVASASRLSLPLAVPLPRVARVVEAVGVELDREHLLRPAAVDVVGAGRPVGLRQREACLAQQLEEAGLELRERDRLVAGHDPLRAFRRLRRSAAVPAPARPGAA